MRNKRSEIERRMRVMAKAKVEMLLGIYQWSDGRPPVSANGTPRVSNRELLRVGGYKDSYKSPASTIFADPYFNAQVRAEMTRREEKSGALVPYDPGQVQTIRDLFFNELAARLKSDPASFSEAQLIAGAEKFELLARSLDNESNPSRKSPDMMNQFNAFISRTVTVMNDSERESLIETTAEAADERVRMIKQLIDEANIVEADADDVDVTSAPVDS